MKKIFILFFPVFFTGCIVDGIEECEVVYINETDHSIQIKGYKRIYENDENLFKNIVVSKGEKSDTHYVFGFPSGKSLFLGYNLTVIYDDTIAIRHNTPFGAPLPVKRNLHYPASYIITDSGNYKMRAEYVFTEEDYMEALEMYRQQHP